MFKRLLCAAAVTLCFSTPAQASPLITGNNLYEFCKDDPNDRVCQGFVGYYTEFLSALYAYSGCRPGEVTKGQTRDIFIKELKRHPEKRHLPAFYIYRDSMTKAFGCGDVVETAIQAIEKAFRGVKPAPR